METFERLESEVRSYCRSFPRVFHRAKGDFLLDGDDRRYIDFFAGAGVLNYGHNNPKLKQKLVDYLTDDGIVHGLDMATRAKRTFLERFEEIILEPRGLSYKVQFPGPTGTNSVEAALKLARKVTGRHDVVYFSRAFHGMTLGSLAVTSNPMKRAGAGVPLPHAIPMPYEADAPDSLEQLEALLDRPKRQRPAAVILETVQAEGGVRASTHEWLRNVAELVQSFDVLLIVDDIQVGCGRTGPFFSFEPAGIQPDLVCLSKSLSGFGLPMALLLIRPELDTWRPGEHNGTFRGHNLAFVTAAEALDYWRTDALEQQVRSKAERITEVFQGIAEQYPEANIEVRGRGMIQGLAFAQAEVAGEVSRQAFEHGLVIETAGPQDEVLKILPPLTIEHDTLEAGLVIIEQSVAAVLAEHGVQEETTHEDTDAIRDAA